MPVGNKARLEHDCICLAEAYQWDPEVVMRLPISRRHRFIKMREMIVASRNGQNTTLDTIEKPKNLREQEGGPPPRTGKPLLSKTGLGYQNLNNMEQ